MQQPKVVVVGAGISGLATAFYLTRRGIHVTVIERASRPGGMIGTWQLQGCTLEEGADSFLAAKPAVRNLANELGIAGDLIASNDAERRIFIVRGGSMVPMPEGMVMMVPANVESASDSPLFGAETRSKLIAELRTPPHERSGDVSIREFVEDHFGPEVFDYVAEPLLSGVYGGDPALLSARSVLPRFVDYERTYGSLVRAAQQEARTSAGPVFLSFRNGMGQLVSSLKAEIDSRVSWLQGQVTRLEQGAAGYTVLLGDRELSATDVVIATPAYEAAELLSAIDADLAKELAAIPYSSALLITMIFEKASFRHPLDGFGFLVPRRERHIVAAATWINTKFPRRVAPGLVAVRAFVTDPQATCHIDMSDQQLQAAVHVDVCRLMQVDTVPVASTIQRWPRSMPQYVVGHNVRCGRIHQRLNQHRGLHLVSNYLDGVGIADCVRWAAQMADRVLEYSTG